MKSELSEEQAEINKLKTQLASARVRHPDQPKYYDHAGTLRFKPNEIVEELLRVGQEHGYGLNELAVSDKFCREDWVQFAQLIGYSVDGWQELSYVHPEDALRVDCY